MTYTPELIKEKHESGDIVKQQADRIERDGYEAIRLRSEISIYSNKWTEALTENLAQADRIKELETALFKLAARADNIAPGQPETVLVAERRIVARIANAALSEGEAES